MPQLQHDFPLHCPPGLQIATPCAVLKSSKVFVRIAAIPSNRDGLSE
jgi:hypothetical protein